MDNRFGIPQRESESVEFKESMSELYGAVKSGAAMLNTAGGGSVYIGVRDNGELVGIERGNRTHDKIASSLVKITPSFWPILETIDLPNGKIVLQMTFPGNSRPYRFDGYPYIRIAASNHQLSEDQYQRLLLERFHSSDRWEIKDSPLTIDDLDTARLVEVVETAISVGRLNAPLSREPSTLLEGFGLMSSGVINNAGAVTFGTENILAQYYPQCRVRLARFDGVTKNKFRDNRQSTGNIFDLLRIATSFIAEHNPIKSRILANQIQRTDTPRYQPEAIREALVNAFVHRDYSEPGSAVDVAIYDDRLEITSSGGLRFGLTVDDLLSNHQSRPWNPTIAHVLQRQGSFENWGRGTIRMIELARIAGLPDPILIDDRLSFTVRMLNSSTAQNKPPADSVATESRVEAALSEFGPLSLSELTRVLNWTGTRRQLQGVLTRLRTNGKVELVGQRRAAKWKLA